MYIHKFPLVSVLITHKCVYNNNIYKIPAYKIYMSFDVNWKLTDLVILLRYKVHKNREKIFFYFKV